MPPYKKNFGYFLWFGNSMTDFLVYVVFAQNRDNKLFKDFLLWQNLSKIILSTNILNKLFLQILLWLLVMDWDQVKLL